MQVVNLPNHFNPENSDTFTVFDYHTPKESFKQMVSLKQNTFSFLVEGRKEVFADKTSIAIENSDFLLMKTGHCLMTETLPNSIDHYRSILFFFSDKALLNLIQKHKIERVKKQETLSIFAFQYDTFLKNFVNGLIEITKLETKIQSKLLALKFEELIIYLMETNGKDFVYAMLTNTNSQLQHFIDIIETNKLNKLTLNELAFLCNMSLSTFKRSFEKQFQSPPSRWFQDKRLEHAAFLLKDHLIRPSDIFETVGYESLSNFIQAFKAKFGITPKQFQVNKSPNQA